MITGIDHIIVTAEDALRAAADYQAVLGGAAAPGGTTGTAVAARLQLENLALVFQAGSPQASEAPEQLKLVLATADAAAAARRLGRRGIAGASNQPGGVFDLDISATHGVGIGVTTARAATAPDKLHDIMGLDHVVIRTPDPERAVALYGGRLGLDLRLDRSNAELGSRMLFFVCGGLVVEVTHDLRKGVGSGADRVWGLAWRARDIDRAHARMRSHGVDVSEMRAGRRPATRVFTVKSHTAGVPTLVIGGEGLERA